MVAFAHPRLPALLRGPPLTPSSESFVEPGGWLTPSAALVWLIRGIDSFFVLNSNWIGGPYMGVADSVIEPGLGTQAPFGKWAYVGVHTWEEKTGFAFSVGRTPWIMRLPPPPRPRWQCCPRGWRLPCPPPQHPDVNVEFFFIPSVSAAALWVGVPRAPTEFGPNIEIGGEGGGEPRCEPVHTVISIWQSRFFLPCMDPQSNSNPKQKKNQYL